MAANNALKETERRQTSARLHEPEWAQGLTYKQRLFVEAYVGACNGNGTQSARMAGYAGNSAALSSSASELLRNPRVAKAIREFTESNALVASRVERQEFWTNVMSSDGAEMKDRLRASELLGRTQADFLERRSVETVIQKPEEPPCEWDLDKLNVEELKLLRDLAMKAGAVAKAEEIAAQ